MKTLLAVPLTSLDPPATQQVRAARQAGAELIELRVDCIARSAGRAGIAAIETLLRQPHDVPFILTVRAAQEGGLWDDSEAERIALLERLGLLRPGYVDVEYATWNRSANVRQKVGLVCASGPDEREAAGLERPKNRLILSYHDVRGTPDDLSAIFDQLAATPAAVVKVACKARDATDACRMLDLLCHGSVKRPTIALAMGPAGLPSRVLAGKLGAFLTFAALTPEASSAPGQPTVAELRERYRWDRIAEATRVYGVIGWPVAHSRSPHIHNAAMAADNIDGVFLPLPVAASYDSLRAFMDYLTTNRRLDVAGLSVTIPHKENALRWLEEHHYRLSGTARRCGAVNTLVRTPDGGWAGENTDAAGLLAALETVPELAGGRLNGQQVDVLGAGGVARAALAALSERGCRITLYNRSIDRARKLAGEFGCAFAPWEERGHCRASVLINCTSVGMWPDVDSSPMPAEAVRAATVVLDTVYNPPETRLLREAAAGGRRAISGIEMFIGQAARQYAQWHGRPAPTAVMRSSLNAADNPV